MPSFPVVSVELTEAEREQLESWSRRLTTAQALAQRSRIVLLVAEGLRTGEVAQRLGVHRNTVAKWRRRFEAERLDGLVDEPRPGRPRTVTDAHVDAVITKTLESAPKDATHWSTRSMAAEVGLTQSAVHRIWRAFGLQPHRAETFKLSRDPQFVAKVRDVVGLYLNPPERAVVLCVDEKSQIQALDRTQPILPMRPGLPERATHDYKRHGTSSLYAALDVSSGKVIGSLHSRHRAIEFKKFLQRIDARGPGRSRRPRHPRQQLDPQDAGDPEMADRTPSLRAALHPDLARVAEPRRALVRRADQQEAAPRRAPLRRVSSTPTSAPGSRPGTTTPSRSCGPRPPTRSSNRSARYCTRINESGH